MDILKLYSQSIENQFNALTPKENVSVEQRRINCTFHLFNNALDMLNDGDDNFTDDSLSFRDSNPLTRSASLIRTRSTTFDDIISNEPLKLTNLRFLLEETIAIVKHSDKKSKVQLYYPESINYTVTGDTTLLQQLLLYTMLSYLNDIENNTLLVIPFVGGNDDEVCIQMTNFRPISVDSPVKGDVTAVPERIQNAMRAVSDIIGYVSGRVTYKKHTDDINRTLCLSVVIEQNEDVDVESEEEPKGILVASKDMLMCTVLCGYLSSWGIRNEVVLNLVTLPVDKKFYLYVLIDEDLLNDKQQMLFLDQYKLRYPSSRRVLIERSTDSEHKSLCDSSISANVQRNQLESVFGFLKKEPKRTKNKESRVEK
mmetsp:Transcript_8760/g.9739  ORF Transcript_8760/g.9739 Transcript_8760/m.9739 type:complete len:369 (-) Transcript_8760:30-1136(-)